MILRTWFVDLLLLRSSQVQSPHLLLATNPAPVAILTSAVTVPSTSYQPPEMTVVQRWFSLLTTLVVPKS
jgi:hypothetical protein